MSGLDIARDRLDSWKSIAAYFGRGERTVRRWEAELGLPVRRMPGAAKGRVYALVEELEAWRSGVSPDTLDTPEPLAQTPEPAPAVPPIPIGGDAERSRWRPRRWAPWLAVLMIPLAGLAWWAVEANARGSPPPPPYAAEKLYVEGTEAWARRTPASLNAALDDFNAALRIDPDYAEAWLGLAKTYNLMREYTFMPESQAYPLARDAARKALALDDRLADAHAALAFVDYWGFWKATEAEREFHKALALDPASAVAHHWYATYLLNRGRSGAALTEIERAAALSPGSPPIEADEGFILYHAGRTDDGLKLLTSLERQDPDFASPHAYLSQIDLDLGRDQDFLRESALANRTTDIRPGLDAARRGLESGGHRGMLEAMLADSLDRFSAGSGQAIEVADAYARLGRPEEALPWLAKSAARRETGFVNIDVDPGYAPIRSTPAFRRLAAQVG